MISFMIAVSFMLHFITLLIIMIQRLKLQKITAEQQAYAQNFKEMEEMMTSYLIELREETEKFYGQIEHEEFREGEVEGEARTEPVQKPNNNEQQPISTEAHVLQLHDQGYTVEDIAKKLKKGKTEVALLIKFMGERT